MSVEEIKKALAAAEQFIVNGVELGYIRMPNPETPDSANDTLPMIRQAQTALESLQRENEELRQDRDRTARNRDMWKGQVERQAAQIEDFRSETKRLQVGVYIETLPAVHLISVFAEDMNERNWDDKRAYIKQQADRIRSALSAQVQDVAGDEEWQTVPKHPTGKMIDAVVSMVDGDAPHPFILNLYRAMLAVAPAKQEGGE